MLLKPLDGGRRLAALEVQICKGFLGLHGIRIVNQSLMEERVCVGPAFLLEREADPS